MASPWRKIELASIPLLDVEVSFSLNTTGPSNSERILFEGPPLTFSALEAMTSWVSRTSIPKDEFSPLTKSSPVTVWIGVS